MLAVRTHDADQHRRMLLAGVNQPRLHARRLDVLAAVRTGDDRRTVDGDVQSAGRRSLVLERVPFQLRPGFREGTIGKPVAVRKLLVPEDLRVDAIRAVVHELAAPPDVIALADELEDQRTWFGVRIAGVNRWPASSAA